MSPRPATPFEFPSINRWIQRVTVVALVTLALTLVGVGFALYAPPIP